MAHVAVPTLGARPPDPAMLVARLGISREAAELHTSSDVIDLAIESFIWTRLIGYDLLQRHGSGPFGGRLFGQVDVPRAIEGGLTGGVYGVTTNPLRNSEERVDALAKNLKDLEETLSAVPDELTIVRTAAEYSVARARGQHAAFISIQGGNALDRNATVLDRFPDLVLRVTLVHLTTSELGATSSPLRLGPDEGLSRHGHDVVVGLESRRVLVDLAHASKKLFWDCVRAHDRSRPLLVSHTGISGVHPHWRNLDDDQLRAIADSGGTVGVMYHSGFLGDSLVSGRAERIVEHLAHLVGTVGEDHASLGSDWDGFIIPPRDMPTCLELPVLTERMLQRGFSPERIQKILGKNFLRVVATTRG